MTPNDAIDQNSETNPAFEECWVSGDSNALSNGVVVFGEVSVHTPGDGYQHADDGSAVTDHDPGACLDEEGQRVEPSGW